METIDKKTLEESKKSSSLKEWTSENLAETFKSERVKLQKCLGEMFANECYRHVYSNAWGFLNTNDLTWFFDPKYYEYMDELEIIEENIKIIDNRAPVLTEKFLKSYKNHNWKIHRLKLKLAEEDMEDIIKKFVDKLCQSRDQKIAEGTWNDYIKYKWALYWAEKKWNIAAEEYIREIEW